MWIKQTEEKRRKEKESFKASYKAPIVIFIGVLIMQFFYHLTGVKRYSMKTPVRSVEEFFSLLPEILLISIALAIATYFSQVFYKKNFLDETGDATTMICDKCNDKKTDDKKYDCSCGGKYTKINEMEWVDD